MSNTVTVTALFAPSPGSPEGSPSQSVTVLVNGPVTITNTAEPLRVRAKYIAVPSPPAGFNGLPIDESGTVILTLAAEPAASNRVTQAVAGNTTPTQNPQNTVLSTAFQPNQPKGGEATDTIATTPTTGTAGPTSSLSPGPGPSPPGPGSNSGAIAGAAIGCLIAGALLGFAIAFFLYRKRRQQNSHPSAVPVTTESKAYAALPPPPPQDALQLAQFLLDATPDRDIGAELQSLGQLIQQHVENNYHLRPVQVDPQTLALALVQLGVGKGGSLNPDTIVALALEPRTRQIALQHVISQVVFSGVDVSSRSRLSMLPAPIAAFLQSIPPNERGKSNADASALALHRWRVLSAFLLHPARSQRTTLPLSETAVAPQASGLVAALDGFLGYFVPGDEASRFQQQSHLTAVITECTKLGYVLLSQPGDWQFVHTPTAQGGVRVAVVCAGLAKTTQKDGTPYDAPHHVVAPTVVQV